MITIYVPTMSVNEDEVKLVSWLYKPGEFVNKNEIICEIESTKTLSEIETDYAGYLYYVQEEGSMIKVGTSIAIISENEEKDYLRLFKKYIETYDKESNSSDCRKKITKKAEILAKKYGLDIENIKTDKEVITESIITKIIDSEKQSSIATHKVIPKLLVSGKDLVDNFSKDNRQERVLILGAGGGGHLAVDILSRVNNQMSVIILDNNQETHNKTLMGVPILGSLSLIDELWALGKFDVVISTIVKDNQERQEIFDSIIKKGIPFTNIIDVTANIRLNVKMGKGNLIVSGCYLAPSVTIGDNNFLAAYTAIEHHSVVGSHCTFGPRFTASGEVKIGDRCKFGTGVFIEPWVKIGQNTTVASGAILTRNIPRDSIVKLENRIHIKSKIK